MIYFFLKLYCTLTLKFYFRKWQVSGSNNLPKGPVIFAPNHQNAFLDAVLIACSSTKNPYFITRSDVFNSKIAKWFLNKLKMVPIYRFRDGYATLKNNNDYLNDYVQKLNDGESFLIFAEGNHGDKLQLRPLQKGIARISSAVQEQLNIPIVPVGIQYDNKGVFRSRVLISFGVPIYVNEIKKRNSDDENKFTSDLLITLKKSLHPLMIHIDDEQYELKYKYYLKYRSTLKNLNDQLSNDQVLISKFPDQLITPENKLNNSIVINVARKFSHANLYIPNKIMNHFFIKNIKDPQFKPSLSFALGSFIIPLYCIFLFLLITLLTSSPLIASVYLGVLLISTFIS